MWLKSHKWPKANYNPEGEKKIKKKKAKKGLLVD
jgi:hypothetical protein